MNETRIKCNILKMKTKISIFWVNVLSRTKFFKMIQAKIMKIIFEAFVLNNP